MIDVHRNHPVHLVLFLLALLAGCSDGRVGFIIDADGSMQRQTPQTIRDADQRRLAKTLVGQWPDAQGLTVDLGHDPVATITDDDLRTWRYPALTVTITLPAPLPQADQERMKTLARRQLRSLHRQRRGAISITTTVAAEQAADPPAQLEPGPTTVWRYTVNKGDTLALIAAAFYGDAGHWRLLLDANPDLDPRTMEPGMVIVIPPLPDDPAP